MLFSVAGMDVALGGFGFTIGGADGESDLNVTFYSRPTLFFTLQSLKWYIIMNNIYELITATYNKHALL